MIAADTYFNDAVVEVLAVARTAKVNIHTLYCVNTTASPAYLQVFSAATGVTVGSTTPKFCIRLNANAAVAIEFGPMSLGGTGLAFAGTTTATGNTGAAISVLATLS